MGRQCSKISSNKKNNFQIRINKKKELPVWEIQLESFSEEEEDFETQKDKEARLLKEKEQKIREKEIAKKKHEKSIYEGKKKAEILRKKQEERLEQARLKREKYQEILEEKNKIEKKPILTEKEKKEKKLLLRYPEIDSEGFYNSLWMGIIYRLLSFDLLWDAYLIGYNQYFKITSSDPPDPIYYDHLPAELATSYQIQLDMVSKLEQDLDLDSQMLVNIDDVNYWDADGVDFDYRRFNLEVIKFQYAPNGRWNN